MSTTTYFAYDKSHRLTTQYILAGEAHYYTYNQRNLITNVSDFKPLGGGDIPRTFSYNAAAERILTKDDPGSLGNSNLFAYWSYDRARLLQDNECQDLGPPPTFVATNYRSHQTPNDCPFGWVDEVTTELADTPTLDGSGSVQRLFGTSFIYDWFGRTIVGSSDKRLRAFTPRGGVEGRTTQEIQWLRSGGFTLTDRAMETAGRRCGPGLDRRPKDKIDEYLNGNKGFPSNYCSGGDPPRLQSDIRVTGEVGEDIDPCCGPDVTDQTLEVLRAVILKFNTQWSREERNERCNSVGIFEAVKEKMGLEGHSVSESFDINVFAPDFGPDKILNLPSMAKCAQPREWPCYPSFVFLGHCLHPGIINYALWGVIAELCGNETESVPTGKVTWVAHDDMFAPVEELRYAEHYSETIYAYYHRKRAEGYWMQRAPHDQGLSPDYSAQNVLAEVGFQLSRRMTDKASLKAILVAWTDPSPTAKCPQGCAKLTGFDRFEFHWGYTKPYER